MWHKPCRTFHPWCPCIKTRCLFASLHWNDLPFAWKPRITGRVVDFVHSSHNKDSPTVTPWNLRPVWLKVCFVLNNHFVDIYCYLRGLSNAKHIRVHLRFCSSGRKRYRYGVLHGGILKPLARTWLDQGPLTVWKCAARQIACRIRLCKWACQFCQSILGKGSYMDPQCIAAYQNPVEIYLALANVDSPMTSVLAAVTWQSCSIEFDGSIAIGPMLYSQNSRARCGRISLTD